MKILVVSLLRLGDIIQQLPLFIGLKNKFPTAEIHLLLNGQFKSVEALLNSEIDKFVYFERDLLQRGLGEANYNILWSYYELESLISVINGRAYDQVYNFTHSKLSAYLIGAFDIPIKKGLVHTDGRFQGLDNRWLKYFNDRFSGTDSSLFHYIEILSHAFAIPIHETNSSSQATVNKIIHFQPLTSDSKKNWSLNKFQKLKNMFEDRLPSYQVKILCAPFEEDALSNYFSPQDLISCNLVEAKQYLKNSSLLVSCDTSIKHLAASTGTPIVEIALGGSDPSKTAAFSRDVTVLNSSVPCAPCVHSKPCSQKFHVCEESVTVEQVFAAVCDRLDGATKTTVDADLCFERAVWKLFFDNVDLKNSSQCSNEAKEIVSTLPAESLFRELFFFNENTQQFTEWTERVSKALPSRAYFCTKTSLQASELGGLIICAQDIIKSKKDRNGYFQYFIESLTKVFNQPVQFYDDIIYSLQEIHQLLEIRKALIEEVNTLIPGEEFYAKGTGSLPVDSSQKIRNCLSGNHKDSVL